MMSERMKWSNYTHCRLATVNYYHYCSPFENSLIFMNGIQNCLIENVHFGTLLKSNIYVPIGELLIIVIFNWKQYSYSQKNTFQQEVGENYL